MEKTENELIAEFMGATKIHEGQWAERYAFHGEVSNQAYFKEKLLYSTSWDWLMPVVEKIEMLTSDPRNTDIGNLLSMWTYYHKVFNGTINTDIEVAYSLVVEFIKWFNTQKP